jgi:hypothetical protein
MTGKVIYQRLVHFNKFGQGGQENAFKTVTSHIRNTLAVIWKKNLDE